MISAVIISAPAAGTQARIPCTLSTQLYQAVSINARPTRDTMKGITRMVGLEKEEVTINMMLTTSRK